MINANNIVDVRAAGYKALASALGSVGFVRFMQQWDNGYGDYTAEKYEEAEDFEDWDLLESKLKQFDNSD